MSINRSIRRPALAASAFSMCLVFSTPALAARTVNVDVDALATTGGINVAVDNNDNAANYVYTIYDGQSVSDTIPVRLCMTGSEAGWTSVAVTFGNQGGNLPGVTAPGDEVFFATAVPDDCRDVNIAIATGALNLADPATAQNFIAIFTLGETSQQPATGQYKPIVSYADIKKFKITVTVMPAVSNVSCFLTDSEGNFLNDCDGVPVTESGSSDGRFAIVTNKRLTQVATNPGQFYYNFVWRNTTGSPQTVFVDFDRTGLGSKGRQALHASVFSGYIDSVTSEEFALANENGIPEGSDDSVAGVQVPSGSSLLVTYHLEWAGLGAPVASNCAGTCAEANQQAKVTATISGAGITTETCSAEAFGHLKK